MQRPIQRGIPAADCTLSRFQDGFARALLDPEATADAEPDIAQLLRQPGFAVYRNTVVKACIDALAANYPAVVHLVGEVWFRAAAAVFVRASPPAQASLLAYGEGFPRFLRAFAPTADLPYLPGVAQLDRFWTEAHTARDEAPVHARALAALTPEQLQRARLSTHAAARWTWFAEHPIYTIWQRNRTAPMPEDPTGIDWRGEGALLVRPGDTVTGLILSAAGCAFLDACAAGRSLGDAATAALAVDTDVDLAALMTRLLEAGALSGPDSLEHQSAKKSQ